MRLQSLFSISTTPLSNAGTEGHALLGGSVSRLHQRPGDQRTFAQRAQLLDAYFLQHLATNHSPGPVYKALHLLTGGGASVSEVARTMGVNLRQLERRSLAYAGVTPKTLSRISSFSHALRLRTESSLTWTQIAHAAQYHDHMHIIRDFREFAGEAPTSALQEIAPEHLIHFAANRLSSSP